MTKRVISKMSLKRFTMLVEGYGTRPANWPEAERDGAIKLLKSDAKAKAVAAEAAGLDDALDMLIVPAPADDAFIKRLETIPHASVEGVPAEQVPGSFGDFVRGLFGDRAMLPQGVGIAAAGLIGVWLGFVASAEPQQTITLDAAKLVLNADDLQDDLQTVK